MRNAFAGIPTFIKEVISLEDMQNATDTSDILLGQLFQPQCPLSDRFLRHELPEMIASIDPLKSGFALDDPADPRHQYMAALKQRFGEWLHKASEALRSQSEENILDAVLMLVTRGIILFSPTKPLNQYIRSGPSARSCSSMVIAATGKPIIRYVRPYENICS